MELKTTVAAYIEKSTGINIDTGRFTIPDEASHGDLALPCFPLTKSMGKAPQQIATDLAEQLSPNEIVTDIQVVGPYLNFFISAGYLAGEIVPQVLDKGEDYGAGGVEQQHIVIESPGPNTNKPLHLGHVRNMLLGNALGAIMEFAGHKVTKVDIVNDRGVHICKSMLAYDRRGNGAEPDKKSDHYVGDRYVRFAKELEKDPTLDDEVQSMLVKREEGDETVVALWEKMRKRALDGMQETYARYGTHIAKAYHESETYKHGKEMVTEGVEKGIFSLDEQGNTIYSNPEAGIDKKVVLRSNGTAIYITQDMYLARWREQDWQMDQMIYVVGNEQEYHFKVLFDILKAFGFAFAERCYHLGYGMVSLPDGKMKSREGKVVDADTIADEMHETSFGLLQTRYPDLSNEELHERAEIIGMAAIKFFVLKYDALKDFTFDRESSLRFDGETGPYIQYTHARCCSMLDQAGWDGTLAHLDRLIEPEEKAVLLHLGEFGDVVKAASDHYQPYLVARYVLELAHLFNTYYQSHKVVQEDTELQKGRLALVASVKQVLANGLRLLGIEAPERM